MEYYNEKKKKEILNYLIVFFFQYIALLKFYEYTEIKTKTVNISSRRRR